MVTTKKSSTNKKASKKVGKNGKTVVALNDADYTKLGKQVAEMYDIVRPSSKQLYTASLIKGFLAGFGGLLGATLGVSILLYLLSMLETIPYVKDISEALQATISGQL